MAAELTFIARHLPALNIIMLGASQGAAFGNAVMRRINGLPNVYSIELGLIFPHMKRRIVTGRTLAVDSNGQVPDPIVNLNLKVALTAYCYRALPLAAIQTGGKSRKIVSYCINAPGSRL